MKYGNCECESCVLRFSVVSLVVGAELHCGHGGEDAAFGERSAALSGVRPRGAQLLAATLQPTRRRTQERIDRRERPLQQDTQPSVGRGSQHR